jgi:hypothetical protein
MILGDEEELIQNLHCLTTFSKEELPIDLEQNQIVVDPIMHSLKNKINAVIKEEGIYVFRLLVTELK